MDGVGYWELLVCWRVASCVCDSWYFASLVANLNAILSLVAVLRSLLWLLLVLVACYTLVVTFGIGCWKWFECRQLCLG
jgi:hypothetical protein